MELTARGATIRLALIVLLIVSVCDVSNAAHLYVLCPTASSYSPPPPPLYGCSNASAPCDSLAQATAFAVDGDVVSVGAGECPLNESLVVSAQITIRGAGWDTGILCPHLPDERVTCIVVNGSVVVQDLVIAMGVGFEGGGLRVELGASAVITGVNFFGNIAQYGGALFVAQHATAVIENSVFESNSARCFQGECGGTSHASHGGGAIYFVGDTLLVRNTTFVENGASAESSSTTVSPSYYSVYASGGAILMNPTAYIPHYAAGFSNAVIVNSTFANNMAPYGGAVAVGFASVSGDLGSSGPYGAYPLNLNITSSTFTHNSATQGGGGAFLTLGNTYLYNVSFSNNEGGTAGGAISAPIELHDSALTVDACLFDHNSAVSGGAVAAIGSPNITNSLFRDNSASAEGGGLYVVEAAEGALVIGPNAFIGNFAGNSGGGAYITVSSGSYMMAGCLFAFNVAFSGGGLYLEVLSSQSNSGVAVLDCTFDANSGSLQPYVHQPCDTPEQIKGGGGLTLQMAANDESYSHCGFSLLVSGGQFTRHTGTGLLLSPLSGCAVDVRIENAYFAQTYAMTLLALSAVDVSIQNVTFIGALNENSNITGMVYLVLCGANTHTLTTVDTTFLYAAASGAQGGALVLNVVEGAGLLEADFGSDTLFSGNSAPCGAAVLAQGSGSLTLRGGRFINNVAGEGGAVAFFIAGTASLSDGYFAHNSATSAGAVAVDAPAFNAYNLSIEYNTAHSQGGAITVCTSEANTSPIVVVIDASTFSHNTASDGGAVYVIADGMDLYVNVTNSLFTSNHVVEYAGSGMTIQISARINTTTVINVVDTMFSENTGGAAVWMGLGADDGPETINLHGSTFVDNMNAFSLAGALVCSGSPATVLSISPATLFANNSLGTAGGGECTSCGCCIPPTNLISTAPFAPGYPAAVTCPSTDAYMTATCVARPSVFDYSQPCFGCGEGCSVCSGGVCTDCENGFAFVDGNCTRCERPCLNCAVNPDNCTLCVAGTHLLANACVDSCAPPCANCSDTVNECTTCFDGNYLQNGECSACASSTCLTCSATACTSCVNGTYLVDGQCQPCSPGCVDCAVLATNCSLCALAYELSDTSACSLRACTTAHCESCSDITCLSCDRGYILAAGICVNPDAKWILVGGIGGGLILVIIIAGVLCYSRRVLRRAQAYREIPEVLTPDATVYGGTINDAAGGGSGYGTFTISLESADVEVIPLDQLEVMGSLGVGGQGSVYRVRHVLTETQMAMKIIRDLRSQEQVEHAVREVRVLINLHHPHCLAYLGVSLRNNELAVLTAFMAGGDLGTAAANMKPTARVTALLGAAKGLAYLHLKNVVHADIKPSNILLDAHGTAVLGDFGISGSGPAQGYTERYAAPETIRDRTQSSASDVFSFGLTCIAVLCQVSPFKHLGRTLRTGDPTLDGGAFSKGDLSTVRQPAAFIDVFQMAQAPDPADRPAVGVLLAQLVSAAAK